MSEYLGYASSIANIAGGIASLTSSKPKTPQIAGTGSPSSGLQIGFANPLTTPGYGFSGGQLQKSGLGDAYDTALGGFLVGGGLDALRSNQTATALGRLGPAREGLGNSLNSIQELRAQVQPGFGALTNARVTAIRDAAAESIGNLRDSLARRQVLGSSFADDAISRTRLAYAKEESSARAEAKVAEIGAQSQFIAQELGTYAQMLGLDLAEANIKQQDIANSITQANLISNEMTRQLQEFGIAGNIANAVSAQVNQQGIAQAQLQLLSQVQAGKDSAGGLSLLASGLTSLGKQLEK